MLTYWLKFLDQGAFVTPLILISISFGYLTFGNKMPIGRKILKSSHGILFVCGLVYASVASKFTYFGYEGWLNYPFAGFLVLGLASVIYSFWGMFKNWYFHTVHIFTLSYAMLVALYGGLALVHDSL